MNGSIISLVSLSILLSACTTPGKRTAVGTGVGAAVGAAAGAIIGHQSGSKGKGALIGGATGAAIGGLVGNRLDKQAQELQKVAETRRTDEGIITTLKSQLLFGTGSAALTSEARSSLGEIAEILKKYPENRIQVVGHADNRGAAALNQTLSENRAQAVQKELASRGVPADTLQATGRGAGQPIASNDDEAGRARNRRVELIITPDETRVR